ncbi:hypothetical protein [Cellulomonas sp.]|uniref:hypothetical protein n=1 Tax=Cellulomonas sp. TaxID=40001 RepID=UPI001B2E1563|nr:hypothetical protein [Cellulomonas sp.]MBO9556743.1 hypothetical protein [Cellulomonas sp.]
MADDLDPKYDFRTLPPRHQPYAGGDPAAALREVRSMVEHAITHQPRSLQKRIGPSEIGTPCDHCLAAKLAGWARTDDGVPWLPYIGTCVHDGLSQIVMAHEGDRNAAHTTGLRWLSEHRVTVGRIGGTAITGSCDLFDTVTGTVIDFKVVGVTTLRTAKRSGPSPVYRTQVNLYGLGFVNAGQQVDHVAIAYLPRNAVSLDDAVWWTAPFDPALAHQALTRANRLHANLTALSALGEAAVRAWISSLPRHPDCHDCGRYPDRPAGHTAPGHHPPGRELDGLIPSTAA